MQDKQLDDLKHFISGTVSQSEVRLREEIIAAVSGVESRLDDKIAALRNEMLDGFAGVGEAIKEINARLDRRDATDTIVDQRLTRLESKYQA
jgi:hypothetical protein